MLDRPIQGLRIAAPDALESGIEPRGHSAPALAANPKKTTGQHRSQRDGDEARKQNRRADRDGELVKQPPDDAAHEHDRDKHGDERQRHRKDREADLARALHGSGPRRVAGLDMAHDVLKHDDGVVHDEADSERERQQREIVEAVIERDARPHAHCGVGLDAPDDFLD
jgi:hypothetical protein